MRRGAAEARGARGGIGAPAAPRPPRAPRAAGGEAGLTLLEVLVAAAILAVALVPLYTALSRGFLGVRSGADAAAASALLERAVEEAKAEAAANFETFTSLAAVEDYGADRYVGGYTLERTVEDGIPGWTGSAGELKRVTCTISRDGRRLGSATFIVHRKGF